MDKFPIRHQSNNHWNSSARQQQQQQHHHHHHQHANATLRTTAQPSSFSTPARVGPAPTMPLFDSADRSSGGTSSQSARWRPGAAVNRKPHPHHSNNNINNKTPSVAGAGAGAGAGTSEADKLFKLKAVEKTAKQVLGESLKDVVYDANGCRDLCPPIASAIVDKVQGFSLQGYKVVCVVSLGSLREKPGVQFGSRCLWNKDTDSFVSVKYSNGSVYAVALIFGLYFD
ncbi:uncharacterized protein LOC143278136 [Babylonia areolata]|uniref:uncharacterized protein LOC143278136 n=1 Tax=Babylonia areolata TaxID=304850 RepID=UPI003FD166CF